MAAPSSDQILQQLEGFYSEVTQSGLVKPGTGVDVERLETWLQTIDVQYVVSTDPKEPTLEGVSFKKSYNESTGLQGVENLLENDKALQGVKHPKDFPVFMPWGDWRSENAKKDFPAPLQQAFKDVFASLDSDNRTPFIDMASLNPDKAFFLEKGVGDKDGSVIDSIAKFMNNFKDREQKPIIRFLIGDDNPKNTAEKSLQNGMDVMKNLFWNADGSPRIDHAKAEIHFGYYNPDFKPK
jgi:hypothetical protein